MESGFVFGGKPYNAVGSNDADNIFDSSNVVANADGSVLERLEYVQGVLSGLEPVNFEPSESPTVDEDGGRFSVSISVTDTNSGPIASGSIDITSITYSLEKSTGGGAFATAGITQPSGATKGTGIVDLEFDIVAAEWAVGDRYRLKISAITATVGSTTYHSGTKTWSGTILEDVDVKTAVDDINTDLGEPDDATTDTVHGKIGTDTEMADNSLFDLMGGAEIVAGSTSASLTGDLRDRVDAIAAGLGLVAGGAGGGFEVDGTPSVYDRVVGDADSILNRLGDPTGDTLGTLTAKLGDNDDASTDPSAASGNVLSKLRGLGDDTDAIFSRLGAPAGASMSADIATLTTYVDTEVAAIKAKTDNLPSDPMSQGVLVYATGTADSGTTTTMVDAERTETTGYLQGMSIVFTSGPNVGNVRVIANWDGTTMTWSPTLPSAVAAGHAYRILTTPYARPTADSTETGTWGLAIGAKADTELSTPLTASVTGTASLMRYLKTLMARTLHASAADNTTAAGSASLAETVGRKDDAAATSIGTTTTLTRYVKAILAAVGFWTGPTNATVSCPTASTTTLLEVTGITKPTQVVAIVSLKNLTVDATIQVQEFVYDGSTTEYKIVYPTQEFTASGSVDAVRVEFTAQGDYKIELTTGAEGANRDVYVRHSRRVTA